LALPGRVFRLPCYNTANQGAIHQRHYELSEMEDKQDDFCEIKQRKAQATGDSVSSLVSDMEKIEIEEDDWVILPPDASINVS
jgi:hypothetical protein